MFEDNAVDFVKKWKTVFGIYCEQGVESTKSGFKQLKITFCQTWPASRRLENMLDTSIQKAKSLNSKINLAEKGK